jgi:hypothetical protein
MKDIIIKPGAFTNKIGPKGNTPGTSLESYIVNLLVVLSIFRLPKLTILKQVLLPQKLLQLLLQVRFLLFL